ncbi:MAG: rhodanese family protein [Roseinatronobacter sp.]|nr:MAG: rhodanese family protein [Roseinatronobacter sp.]
MTSDPVIAPHAQSQPLRLLDVRDADSFAAGHASGAVRVPIESWVAAARTRESGLENTAYWAAALNALGIGPDGVAGIYDDGRMIEAARVWFMLQYFGVPAVILNGGWPDVQAAGLTGRDADPRPLNLRPGSGPVGLMDRAQLKAALDTQTVFDTRTQAEHRGDDLKANARGGHLPGAVLLPHADLLDGPRLRPPAVLRARLEAAGFEPGQPITTHCDGGGRAALAAVAALQAGLQPISVYYLSFSDWAADETCPVNIRN